MADIYTDDLRKNIADQVSEIQKRDGLSLTMLSEIIFDGNAMKLVETFKAFDDIRQMQNELSRMQMVDVYD